MIITYSGQEGMHLDWVNLINLLTRDRRSVIVTVNRELVTSVDRELQTENSRNPNIASGPP